MYKLEYITKEVIGSQTSGSEEHKIYETLEEAKDVFAVVKTEEVDTWFGIKVEEHPEGEVSQNVTDMELLYRLTEEDYLAECELNIIPLLDEE